MNFKSFFLLVAIAVLFVFAHGKAKINIQSSQKSDATVNTPATGTVSSSSESDQDIKRKSKDDDFRIYDKDSSSDPQSAKEKEDGTKVKINTNTEGTAKLKAKGTDGYYQVSFQDFVDEWSTIAQEGKFVAIFMASLDESGEYWCPDCEDARDNLNNVLIPTARELGIEAFHVDVGNPQVWRKSNHPLRIHEVFPINSIPTIILFENGKVIKSLIEEECHSAKNIRELFNSKKRISDSYYDSSL